jgi:heme/copper-type cytochrome/quinol oxidase subunit 3
MSSVTIGEPQVHLEDPNLIGRRWRTGVVLLILADASFVAALLFSYFYLRGLNTERAWLAPHQATASIGVGWAIAGGVVVSALVYRWGQNAIRADRVSGLVSGTAIALVLVVATAAGQVWQLTSFPFGVADSAYSSAMYTLAGANLFHLLLTAFLGIAMWNRGRLRIYSAASNWQVRLVGVWWTWIAVAAVLAALTTSFIASPNLLGR